MKTMLALSWHKRFLVCGWLAACTMTATLAGAQSPALRIPSELAISEQAPLKGSLHPLAQAQFDAGRMPTDTRLNGMSIFFNRSAAQQADLLALIAAQQDPASPLFHQWLNPDEFGARFGMAQADLDAVQSWLEQQGFSIDSVARSRNMIRFSGSVSQIERAFSTQMHYYKIGSEQHFAPSTELMMPATIASTVDSIRNLNDFRPKPLFVRGNSAQPRPNFTSGISQAVHFAPGDIKVAYDVNPLITAGFDGTGQTITIVGQSSVVVTDIEHFQSAAGLTVKDPTLTLMPGTGVATVFQGDETESDLDLEWSSSMAPGASVNFVYTGNNPNFGTFDALTYAIQQKIGSIISVSYGACEPFLGTDLEVVLLQASTQGQSVISASGDDGSTSCFQSTSVTNPTLAQQEVVAVSYPASSPYVTGLGGTEITQANSAVGTYWTSNGTTDVVTSATMYIPEIAWNDDTPGCGAPNCLSASGGGASTLFTKPSWQTGVAGIPADGHRDVPDVALYSSPSFPAYLYCTSDTSSWNTGQLASCTSGFRDATTNDLTFAGGTSFAAPIFAGMLALINQKAGYGTTGQGLINPTLYTLASNATTYAAAFHDVTSGNNDCTAGAGYCAQTTGFSAGTGYDQVTGLGSVDLDKLATAWPANTLTATTTALSVSPASASVGTSVTLTATVTPTAATGTVTFFDGATALGSPVTLVSGKATFSTTSLTLGTHSLKAVYAGSSTYATSTSTSITLNVSSSSGTTATTTTLTASSTTPTFGASVTFTATVSPTAATGTVLFTEGTTTLGQGTLSSGTATFSTSTLSSGAHTITATYEGDATYASSTSSAVTVTVSTPSFTLSGSAVTVSQGSTATSTITVTPAGGYTGTIKFTVSSPVALCYTAANFNVTGASAVSATVTLDTNLADCGLAAVKTGAGGARRIGATQSAPHPFDSGPSIEQAAFGLAGLLLAGVLGWRRGKLRILSCLIALGVLGFTLSACGGGGGGGSTSSPYTPKGTYSISVTATDSVNASISTTTTVSLTVQ